MDEYYEVSFEEIKSCEYPIEAPSKKEAMKYAIKLWKKEHRNIPVINCLSHHFSKKLSKRISKYYGKEDCKKFLSKP